MRASAPAGVAPGDSGRIVWGVFHFASGGIFVLTAGVRERTRDCSPQACVQLMSRLEAEHLGTLS